MCVCVCTSCICGVCSACTVYTQVCVCVLVLPYMVNSICDGKAPNPKEELYIQRPLPRDQGSNHSEQMEAFIMATPNQCENSNEWVFSKFLKTSKPLIQFHLNIIITHKHTGDLVVKNLFLFGALYEL